MALAELVRNSADVAAISTDTISPMAGVAVEISAEVSMRLGVDPSVAASAAAELENAFRDGAEVGSFVIAHNCQMFDGGHAYA